MSLVPETVSGEWIVLSGIDDNAEYIGAAFKDAFVFHPHMLPQAPAARHSDAHPPR